MANILVIDDDASLLQMISLMLKRAGHIPILAHDGYEGIQIAREQQPDLAVVDLMMPGLSGYEVCRTLREDPETEGIPLLVLTALSDQEPREMAEDAGADDFVTKPITREDLVSRVEELLRSGPRNYPLPAQPAPAAQPSGGQAAQAPAPAPTAPPGTGPLTEPYPSPAPQAQPPEPLPLVAVMGLTSGTGATTLAVNLGMALRQFGRTCIVDLQTQVGEVAIQLKMTPPHATWHDLMGIAPGDDKRRVGRALMLDQTSEIAILAAPLKPVEDRLSDAGLEYILEVLSEGFQYIVADLPPALNPMNVMALRRAKNVLLVIGDDPASLVIVRDVLSNIERLDLAGDLHVVLNRTRPQGVSYEEVMEALNRPLLANVPYEPAQVEALRTGTPLVILHPDSLFSQVVMQVARQL